MILLAFVIFLFDAEHHKLEERRVVASCSKEQPKPGPTGQKGKVRMLAWEHNGQQCAVHQFDVSKYPDGGYWLEVDFQGSRSESVYFEIRQRMVHAR